MNALKSRFRDLPAAAITVSQNFGWMLASRGVSAVFSIIYLAIITRTLGVSGFGKFALITGAAQFLSSLLAFQTWQIVVQYGVSHIDNNDPARLARLYRGAVLLDAVSAVAGIIASATILHFFAEQLGMTPTLARATLIFNVIILISMHSTPLGIMRLRDRFSIAAAAESATPILRLAGAITAYFVHPKLQGFLIAWAIAELLTAAAHWYGAWRIGDVRLMMDRGKDVGKVIDDNPGIVRYALTTNFSQSLSSSVKQLPLFLVGGLTGTAAAGAFRLAAQLSRSLTILAQMIARAAFPEFVRTARSLGVGGLAAIVLRTLRLAAAVGAVVFGLVVLFGRFVLEAVGGPEFGRGYESLLWLAGAGCIELVIVAFEPSITAAQRSHLTFFSRLVATAVMIGGAVLLEPTMGADGVAAAVMLNSLTQAVLLGLILLWLVRHGEYLEPQAQPQAPAPSRDRNSG